MAHKKSSVFKALLAVSLMVGTGLGGVPTYARAEEALTQNVSFDFTKGHPFTGIGAHVWMGTKNTVAGDALLDAMRAQFVRVSLLPKAPPEELPEGGTVADALAVIRKYDTPAQKESFITFRDRMTALGIKPRQIFWTMPDQWVVTDYDRPAGSKPYSRYAKTEHISDYANVIVAQLIYTTELGLEPDGVELINEPHGAWGCQFTPEQYSLLVQEARRKLDENGLSRIKIDGPAVGLRNYSTYQANLRATGQIENLDMITAHVYQSPEELADPKTPGVSLFMGKGEDGPITISEFGVKGVEGDPIVPGSDNDPTSMPYALKEASTGLMLIGMGAQSVLAWELENSVWSKEDHGLIGQDGTVRPAGTALQTLFARVPVSTTVVASGSSVSPALLTLQAFRVDREVRAGRIAVLAVNRTDVDQRIKATFTGTFSKPTKVVRMETYNGVGSILRVRDGVFVDASGALTAVIPAGSVASIRIE